MNLKRTRLILWVVPAITGMVFLGAGGPGIVSSRLHQARVERVCAHNMAEISSLTMEIPVEPKAAAERFSRVLQSRDRLRCELGEDPAVDALIEGKHADLEQIHAGCLDALEQLPAQERVYALRDVWVWVNNAELPMEFRRSVTLRQQSAASKAWTRVLDDTLLENGLFQAVATQLPQVSDECGGEFAFRAAMRLKSRATSLWQEKLVSANGGRSQLKVIRDARKDIEDDEWKSQKESTIRRALTDEAIELATAKIKEGQFAQGLNDLERAEASEDLLPDAITRAIGLQADGVQSRLIERFNKACQTSYERDALRELERSVEPVSKWVDVSKTVQESRERIANLLPQTLRGPTAIESPVHTTLLDTLPVHERTQQLLDLALLGVVAQAQPAKEAVFELGLAPILRQPNLHEITLSQYARGRLARLTAPDDPSPEYVAIVPPASSSKRAVPGLCVDAKVLYDLVDDRLFDIRLNEDAGKLHVVRVELENESSSPVVQYDGAIEIRDLFTPGQHGFKTATLSDEEATRAFAESIDRLLSVSLVKNGAEYVAREPTVTGRDLGGPASGRLSIEDVAVLHHAYSEGEKPGFSLDGCYDAKSFVRVLSIALEEIGDDLPVELRKRVSAILAKASRLDLIPDNHDDPTGWNRLVHETLWLGDHSGDGIGTSALPSSIEARIALNQAFNRAANSLARSSDSLTPAQTFRFDAAYTAGTEVGWTLAYTDLMMKVWSISASGTEVPIPGFVPLLDIRIDPSLVPLLRELPAVRMWLELDPSRVLRDDKSVRFASLLTQVSARGNDGSPIPSEKRPAPDYEASISRWNSMYSELAEFEPQYARLDQIMRWSVVFSYMSAGNDQAHRRYNARRTTPAWSPIRSSRLRWLTEIEPSRIIGPAKWWKKHPELREQTKMPWLTSVTELQQLPNRLVEETDITEDASRQKIMGTRHPVLPRLVSPRGFILGYGSRAAYTGGVSLPTSSIVEKRAIERATVVDASTMATARLTSADLTHAMGKDDFEQLLPRFGDSQLRLKANEVEQLRQLQHDRAAYQERWEELFKPLDRYVLRSSEDGAISLWAKRGNLYSASSRLWLPYEGVPPPAGRTVSVHVEKGANQRLQLDEFLRWEKNAYPMRFGEDVLDIPLSTLAVGAANDGRVSIAYTPRGRVLAGVLTDALAAGKQLPAKTFCDVRVSKDGRRFEAAVKPEYGGGLIIATQGGGGGKRPPTDISSGGLADPDGWNGRYEPEGAPSGGPAPDGPHYARFRMTGKPGSTLGENPNGTLLVVGDAVWAPPRSAKRADIWLESGTEYEYVPGWANEETNAIFLPTSKASFLAGLEGRETPAESEAWSISETSGFLGIIGMHTTVAVRESGATGSDLAAEALSGVRIPCDLASTVRIRLDYVDDPVVEFKSGGVRIEGLPNTSGLTKRLNNLLRHRTLRKGAACEIPTVKTKLSRAQNTLDLIGARRVTAELRNGRRVLCDSDGTIVDADTVWRRSGSEPTRIELSADLCADAEALHGFFRHLVVLRTKYGSTRSHVYLDLGLPDAEQRLAACANLTGVEFQVHPRDVEGVRGAERALAAFSEVGAVGGPRRYRARIVHNRGPETIAKLEKELLSQPASGDYLDLCICIDSFSPVEFQQVFALVPKLIASKKYSAVGINPSYVSLRAMALLAKESVRQSDAPLPSAHLVVPELTKGALNRLEKFKDTQDESLLAPSELGLLRDESGEITEQEIDAAVDELNTKVNGQSQPIVLRTRSEQSCQSQAA